MTKKTTRLGLFGLAAMVAILSVALLSGNVFNQEAAANAANKNGFAYSGVDVMSAEQGATHLLLEYEFESSDKKPWLADFTAECSTATHVKASGKGSKSTDQSLSEAEVFFTLHLPGDPANKHWAVGIDGSLKQIDNLGTLEEPLADVTDLDPVHTWNFCKQEMVLDVKLNELFTRDADGNIVWCQGAGEPLTPECEQSVEIFLENAGTRNAKVVLDDLPHGTNYVYVWAHLTEDGSDTELLETDKTSLWIGKRILILDPLHFDGSE